MLHARRRFGVALASVLAVAIAVVVLAVGGTALASQLLDGSSGYTGCLTQSGDLLKFAEGGSPLKACTGTQVPVHFTGDLPAILAGSGLSGSSEGGVLTLSIAPSHALPQGCQEFQVAQWDGNAWVCGPAFGPLP